MNELLQALGAGADAATIGICAVLLRHSTRLVRLETIMLVVARKLRIDASILKE